MFWSLVFPKTCRPASYPMIGWLFLIKTSNGKSHQVCDALPKSPFCSFYLPQCAVISSVHGAILLQKTVWWSWTSSSESVPQIVAIQLNCHLLFSPMWGCLLSDYPFSRRPSVRLFIITISFVFFPLQILPSVYHSGVHTLRSWWLWSWWDQKLKTRLRESI